MASRELVYRISLDTATAKREASHIRATFEKELRQISLGKLDTSQLSVAAKQAQQLKHELDGVAESGRRTAESFKSIQVPSIGNVFGDIIDSFKLPPALLGGGVAVGGIALALAPAVLDMAKLGTESIRTGKAFEILSGGASQAEKNIAAIQNASGGTVSEFQAMQIGNQALALGLANTAEGFARLTQAARAVAFVSPVINDIQSAISELGLAAANTSYRRLDQLGLSVSEVRSKMSELRRENENFSESQAFLEAAVSTLLSKYGAILDSEEARATGLERIATAIADIRTQAAEEISITVNYVANPIADLFEQKADTDKKVQQFLDSTAEARRIVDQGVKGADQASQSYIDSIKETVKLWDEGSLSAANYRIRIDGLVTGLQNYEAALKQTQETTQKTENDRLASIFEQQPAINQALAGRAQKAAGTIGIEQSIAIYQQQKAQIEELLQQLADTGVKDTGEIAIRVADITQQLMAPFDELEARAKAGFSLDVSAFEQIGTALSNMNAGFTDFLPGVTSAREELISLSDQLMLTGQLSDEQAARLKYLASVAISVTENGSQLSNVIGDLGSEFLESNSFAAELVNQMVLAEAAYRNGAITGDIYAGIMAALSGKLLTVAQAAGIATGSIYALNQAQSDMASAGGLAIGGSIANRIQAQQGAQARDHNRRELERYNRDKARAEEQSAKRAGKVLEDGAKKASQELKAALDKVPGLFGTTQVTEQDMKDTELGIYVEKADEYLRRLRDEVKNGKDWADVSIGQAREGLVRAGLDPGVTEEQTLALLERAINDSSLFSAKENIPIFINEEAVKYAQDLQTKSEEGRKNIYEYFGVQVDEAVSAATGGGGAAIEVKPPDLIDVDPLTAGLQTGLDDVMVKTGEKMRQAVSSADVYSSDELKTMLYGTGQKSGATGKQIIGPLPKEIAITADPAVTNWLASTGAQGGTMQGPQPKLTPTIDTTGLQAELDKIELAASVHLAVTIEDIQLFRDTVTALVKPSVQVSFALATTAEGGQAQTPVAALVAQISTDIGANAATFATQGATVAQIIIAGMIASMKAQQSGEEGGETTPFATALAGKLSTELTTLQGTFYAVGFGPAQSVQDGFTGYSYADMGSGVLDAVTTSIRKDADNYKQRGSTIASYIQAGINEGFGSNLSFTYAMNSGAAWAQGFMAGALGAVGGGALAQAISDKVIKDIADEMEK